LNVGLSPALGATGAKALATQNGPSGLRLKWDAVGLAALIADNIEAFALAASALA
jgi:hypothetical protein